MVNGTFWGDGDSRNTQYWQILASVRKSAYEKVLVQKTPMAKPSPIILYNSQIKQARYV
ncbi:hypothetical protein [Moorena sp. SIO3H5]|uniref:hypothetical protein n=1 Tax=Moorena sp. SIO3H5 TaxID=2607834 RepID=UPI0013B7BA38|nr:hypothetical protein [Moorena sp. SIO3H5]NEO72941.1 hypothetical protein [Moorena sp. SIO3H5]